MYDLNLSPETVHLRLKFPIFSLLQLSIDVVELEPTVYDVAKKYFDLTENERVKVKIEDGVKFMERGVNESESNENENVQERKENGSSCCFFH